MCIKTDHESHTLGIDYHNNLSCYLNTLNRVQVKQLELPRFSSSIISSFRSYQPSKAWAVYQPDRKNWYKLEYGLVPPVIQALQPVLLVMSFQLLANELSTLIQESKRKNIDLRNARNVYLVSHPDVVRWLLKQAAEKSLTDLKALPNTSESQLAAGQLHNRCLGDLRWSMKRSMQSPKLCSYIATCL